MTTVCGDECERVDNTCLRALHAAHRPFQGIATEKMEAAMPPSRTQIAHLEALRPLCEVFTPSGRESVGARVERVHAGMWQARGLSIGALPRRCPRLRDRLTTAVLRVKNKRKTQKTSRANVKSSERCCVSNQKNNSINNNSKKYIYNVSESYRVFPHSDYILSSFTSPLYCKKKTFNYYYYD